MKIKCPFCRNIYDPEACDNTCPVCNKKLMVSVFKKKPENKPGGAPATTIRPPTTITHNAPTPPAPAATPPPIPTAAKPVPEFVAPKAPMVVPFIKPPPAEPAPTLQSVTSAVTPEAVVSTPAHKPVPTEVVASPAPAAVPVKKMTRVVHGQPKAGLELVVSIGRNEATDWDAVIRMPVQVFKFANLIPARAREAIESEGIAFEELRKAVEHADHIGPLLDIQTQTQRVHIAIEPHG
ncbi:MAG: hypothetical protein NTY53_05840 [Kiritimatiellaeota bacterium]|nr:hypothetical protein [Kiritimatiellota bacterium]